MTDPLPALVAPPPAPHEDRWRDPDLSDLLGPVDGLLDASAAVGRGDWVAAGLSGAGAGLSALGFLTDPLAGLFSVGIGFLVDHLEPFPTWLDQLCGDPEVVESFATTWHHVADRVHDTAADYREAARVASADWDGAIAAAYAAAADAGAAAVDGMGSAVSAVAIGVEVAAGLVAWVRSTVRDELVHLVSFALARAAEFLTLVGAGPAIARFAARVVSTASRLRRHVDDLLASIEAFNRRLGDLLVQLNLVGQRVGQWAQRTGVDRWAARTHLALPALRQLAERHDELAAPPPAGRPL